MTGLGRWALVGLVVVVGAGTVSIGTRWFQDRSPAAVAADMQGELGEIRGVLDECLSERDRLESDFDSLSRRTEQMREELDRLEELDPRGVPAESYEAYLHLVDEYNDAIPRWEEQADSLERQSSECRELAETHNEQADSLQQFLLDEGLVEQLWLD